MERWLEDFARATFRRSGDTAHDLKTPLNVAVLNLELLRMRIRKLAGDDDEKLATYAKAIELELRRMARIFDAYFLLSSPPKNDEVPESVDIAALANEIAGYEVANGAGSRVIAHEPRIRQALKMFFEGASRVLETDGRQAAATREDGQFHVTISGRPAGEDFELTRVFKFYYTDPSGNPDVSLAAARLVAETYGGELLAGQENDKVWLRFSLPLGEK